jgi:NADH-quinone oxidoreductase chain G
MFLIQVNGSEYLIKKKLSILEACKSLGYVIPRFCYHESLSISGNCRMCLVEVVGIEKPAASCVTEIENGMKIWLNTTFVKKARENVLESLLLNHPLDCPICDQGGECDLQDQTLKYSIDTSKNFFYKNSVSDKNCGPIIKTIMTRCIHCTRCVRFSSELSGNEFYGTTLRGGHTEISSYLDKTFNSEISGSVIDLCPVGALTSKVQAFKARPWELKVFESVDLTDGVGSNVYITYKDNDIVRVLPRPTTYINEMFISDKARFFFDSLKKNRVATILKRDNFKLLNDIKTFYFYSKIKYQKLEKILPLTPTTWNLLADNYIWSIKASNNICLLDNNLGSKFLSFFVSFSNRFKNNFSVKKVSSFFNDDYYVQNNTGFITDINKADYCYLFSCNIRFEACIINLRLRVKQKLSDFNILNFGSFVSNDIINRFTNSNLHYAFTFMEGQSLLSSVTETSKKTLLFIFGESLNNRGLSYNELKSFLTKLSPESKFIKVSSFINLEGLNFFGLKNFKSKDLKFGNNVCQSNVLAFKLEDTFNSRKTILHYKNQHLKGFCWWISGHLSSLCTKMDFVLPTHAFFQEADFVFNLEQRPQNSGFIFKSFSESRSFPLYFSRIFFDLNSKNKNPIKYDSYVLELRSNVELFETNKQSVFKNTFKLDLSTSNLVVKYPIKSIIEDFFLFNNSLSNNSKNLQKCSIQIRDVSVNFDSQGLKSTHF